MCSRSYASVDREFNLLIVFRVRRVQCTYNVYLSIHNHVWDQFLEWFDSVFWWRCFNCHNKSFCEYFWTFLNFRFYAEIEVLTDHVVVSKYLTQKKNRNRHDSIWESDRWVFCLFIWFIFQSISRRRPYVNQIVIFIVAHLLLRIRFKYYCSNKIRFTFCSFAAFVCYLLKHAFFK